MENGLTRSVKHITIEDVRSLFDSIIYLRGEEYFESDCVKSIESIDSSTIAGVVRGNQNYNVSVTIDSEGDIACECSCPCDFNCKHAAALLLKWLSIKGEHNKESKKARLQKKESIRDILDKKSREELIGLLTEFLKKRPELKSLVKIEREEIVSEVRNLLSEFVDWDEVSALISQLEVILEGIRRDKGSWGKALLSEMEICFKIMIKGQDNVHDEGELGSFLEDWSLLYGEIFSSLKPSRQEKRAFLQKITEFIKNDNYGFDSSFEKAFLGMCASKEDIELIKEFHKPNKPGDEGYYDGQEEDYSQFCLELYDKIGCDDEYLKIARTSGFALEVIDKLIVLKRFEEALEECEKVKKKENFEDIENRKIEILGKLGRKDEVKEILLRLAKITGDIGYALKLKRESNTGEWKSYLKQIVFDSAKKNRNSLLSKLYFYEGDYKNAFEHSKSISDMDYLELLASKLSIEHPLLACSIFKRLCFSWIDSGSGWPYKKAGKMLEAIKKLDVEGTFFTKTKNEIIGGHKKKYSLMELIKDV